jgi:hypothetical protein
MKIGRKTMQADINYLAVLVAGVSSMVLGFLWYGPLFGKKWVALMGWSDQVISEAKAKGGMGKNYVITLIGSFVMAYVLAHALIFASEYLNVFGVMAGVMAGFWNWLGFMMPLSLNSVLWEGKSWKLWMLNNGYSLTSLIVMGIILSVW